MGSALSGKRALIVDDVITAGTAVGEAIAILAAAGATPAGVVVGLDRQERGAAAGDTLSAVQAVTATYGVPVYAVATLTDLMAFITTQMASGAGVAGLEGMTPESLLAAIRAYRTEYGAVAASSGPVTGR